jgi:GAF domain-containing protein
VKIEVEKIDDRNEMYERLLELLGDMLHAGDDEVSSLANVSSLLGMFLSDVNWVGFYLAEEGVLKLGPFQGKPAVAVIRPGEGVCGTAAAEMRTQRVDDVHSCSNHIACDEASASEIVIPMIKGGRLLGVLDIDSPVPSRFDEDDERGLERFVAAAVELIY